MDTGAMVVMVEVMADMVEAMEEVMVAGMVEAMVVVMEDMAAGMGDMGDMVVDMDTNLLKVRNIYCINKRIIVNGKNCMLYYYFLNCCESRKEVKMNYFLLVTDRS